MNLSCLRTAQKGESTRINDPDRYIAISKSLSRRPAKSPRVGESASVSRQRRRAVFAGGLTVSSIETVPSPRVVVSSRKSRDMSIRHPSMARRTTTRMYVDGALRESVFMTQFPRMRNFICARAQMFLPRFGKRFKLTLRDLSTVRGKQRGD